MAQHGTAHWLLSYAMPKGWSGPSLCYSEGWGGKGSGVSSATQLMGLGCCGGCMPSTSLCLAWQQQLLAWALSTPCFSTPSLPPSVLRGG